MEKQQKLEVVNREEWGGGDVSGEGGNVGKRVCAPTLEAAHREKKGDPGPLSHVNPGPYQENRFRETS